MKILVADLPGARRRTLAAALRSIDGTELVAVVSRAEHVLSRVADGAVDGVLLDPTLDGGAGAQVARELVRLHPKVRCVLLGVETAPPELMGAGVLAVSADESTPERVTGPLANALVPAKTARAARSSEPPRDRREARPRSVPPRARRSFRPPGARAAEPRGDVMMPAGALANVPRTPVPALASRDARTPQPPLPSQRRLVAIGASTGGPPALVMVLRELGPSFPLPVLVVQHMGASHLPFFVQSLATQTGMRVSLAEEGVLPEPGHVYVAPGDRHMQLVPRGSELRLALSDAEAEHNCRPAVDPLFRSIAASMGSAVVAVVLTGMGSDGALGALDIARNGAPVIVQDRPSSVVWGMPGATVATGAATVVVPIEMVAKEILRWSYA